MSFYHIVSGDDSTIRAVRRHEVRLLTSVVGVFFHSPQVVPRIYGRNNISKLGVEHELKDAMEDDVACHVISAAAGFQQAELILKNDTSLDSAHVSRSRLRHEEALNHLQQGMQKLNLRFKTHTQTLTPSTIMNVARLALATVRTPHLVRSNS